MNAHRRSIRYVAAAVAASMAAIYYLIGIGTLSVGSVENGDVGFILVFGALAGSAFLLGAVLLVTVDRRWLWMLGAVFQVFVYIGYFSVARDRTPAFEAWGITLRVIQVPLLAALLYLAWRRPVEAAEARLRHR